MRISSLVYKSPSQRWTSTRVGDALDRSTKAAETAVSEATASETAVSDPAHADLDGGSGNQRENQIREDADEYQSERDGP